MNLHTFNKNINCNIIQYNKNINTSLRVQHGAVRVSKNFVHSGCHRISSSGLFGENSSLAHVIQRGMIWGLWLYLWWEGCYLSKNLTNQRKLGLYHHSREELCPNSREFRPSREMWATLRCPIAGLCGSMSKKGDKSQVHPPGMRFPAAGGKGWE